MSCRMHYRFEYRGGFVVEGETVDRHRAQEFLDHRAARLKERGTPYIVEGLTLTYDDTKGTRGDLHRTVTLTWTDRPEEAR